MGVLSTDTGSGTVGPTEDDRARNIPSGHVMCLAGGIDDLIDGLHGEVESHELASTRVKVNFSAVNTRSRNVHWSETGQSSASRNTCKAHLGDRCVNDALLAELVQ